MLSRRRSSEQASHSNQFTPAATRIENFLRNVQILFHLSVVPDLQRPNLPRPPEQSGEIPQNDTSAMRRIFNREQHPKKPGVHTLVVASTRNSTLRLYHVVDAARITHRYWNLADLRKVDGLGAPVSESLQFALYFSNSKPIVYRTQTPRERGTFLWSLLQICVSRLKRAPPVVNLRLLDLKTVAEHEETEQVSLSSPSDPNLRLQPPVEELPLSDVRSGSLEGSTNHLRMPTNSPKNEDRPEDGERSPDPYLKSRARPRPPSRMQKVTRTMSEPKAISIHPDSDDSEKNHKSAVTETHVKGMNIDERAFLAAAKRMGAKRSFEVGHYEKQRFSSISSDPKARLFQNRIRASDANTAKVVAERRLQQEKKQFRLCMEEQMDLLFALELFGKEKQKRPLHEFGMWADGCVQALEAENISDLVNVEKRAPEYLVQENSTTQSSRSGVINKKDPQDLLIQSIMFAEPWLEKCQTLLGPYATLAESINNEVITLERQRTNVQRLEEALDDLLQVLIFDDAANLEGLEESLDPKDISHQHFHKTVKQNTSKAAALSKVPSLSGMKAVKAVQLIISSEQNKASATLLPALKKFLSKLYCAEETGNFEFTFSDPSENGWRLNEEGGTEEFLKGAECLAECGNNSFVDLVDHYVAVSSAWVVHLMRFLMRENISEDVVKGTLKDRARMFGESLFYICVEEGMRAFRLFASILDSSDRDGFISISGILRRQISDAQLLEQYITSEAEDNKTKQVCVNLHLSQSLDFYGDQVNGSTDKELHEILCRVESRNRAQGSLWIECESKGKERTIADCVITRHDRVVRESVSNFVVACNDLSLTCQAKVEKHTSDIITEMDAAHAISTEQGRATFFSKVMEAVDLCCELSAPVFRSMATADDKAASSVKTKALCERLIAAAMRSTEIASTGGLENSSDSIKLQCYGYIAAKLEEGKREDFLIQLAHLSSRVRKHVMTKWAAIAIFETILGGLRIDGDKPTTETYSRFRSSVMEMTVQMGSNRIKVAVNKAMESAADTRAILPFYSDLIDLVKDNMEDVLRKVRKDKAVSDIRPKLLSFSRELLSNLRAEQKRLFDVLTKEGL